MDAEIWSHADIQNGRRILFAFVVLILAKEIGVVLLPALGFPAIDPFWIPSADAAGAFKGPLTLAIKLVLIMFIYLGLTWARHGLWLIYLSTSAYALARAAQAGFPQGGLGSTLTFANGVVGLFIGLSFALIAPIRAFAWSRAAGRLTIPIPSEDEPHAFAARSRSVGETLTALIRGVVSLSLLLAVMAAAAYSYGLIEIATHWIRH